MCAGLGTIWVGGRLTGGASMRNGRLGMRCGNAGSGAPHFHAGGSSGSGVPSWSTCVAYSGVAFAMPLAPGKRPYRWSKLRFSA